MKTINDVKELNFPGYADDGVLVPIEIEKQIPFKIKRFFYVYGVNSNKVRGLHAHHKTQQVLICLSGEIECICKDSSGGKKRVTLDYPTKGLYIPEMIWDEQIYKSGESILLSLASTKYDPLDYIHNYKEFMQLKDG